MVGNAEGAGDFTGVEEGALLVGEHGEEFVH